MKVFLTNEEFEEYEEIEVYYGEVRKAQVILYSKVSSRSMVCLSKVVNQDIKTESGHEVELSTLMYVIRADGRMSWKFNGMWGFTGHNIDRRYRSQQLSDLMNRLWYCSFLTKNALVGQGGIAPELRDANQQDTQEMLMTLWLMNKYPGCSFELASAVFQVFGRRKKPERMDLSTLKSAFDNVVSVAKYPLVRRALQAEFKDNLTQDSVTLAAETVNITNRCTSVKALECVMYIRNNINIYSTYIEVDAINKLFDVFPHCSTTNLVYRDLHLFNDAMRAYRRMNKIERELVHGSNIRDLHDSTTEVMNRWTEPRLRMKKSERLRSFEYTDEDKALENKTFKLVVPLDLAAIGTAMRICVGSYDSRVVGRSCLILAGEYHGTRFCIEVDRAHTTSNDDKHLYTVVQAKLDCNYQVSGNAELNDAVLSWCEEKGIIVHARGDVRTPMDTYAIKQRVAPAVRNHNPILEPAF